MAYGEGCAQPVHPFALAEARAREVSTLLSKHQIRHAVVGGMAVHANVMEVAGIAPHVRGNIDVLLERKDFKESLRVIREIGLSAVDLCTVRACGEERNHLGSIRFVFAGERVRPNDCYTTPELNGGTTFPSLLSFECIRLLPLLFMKLTSYRHVDIVHIQDLLAVGLITKKIEAALPADLRKRLEHVKAETKREGRG